VRRVAVAACEQQRDGREEHQSDEELGRSEA
jgi:hypothetical protein